MEGTNNQTVIETYVLSLMLKDYQGLDKLLIVLLGIFSILSFYPLTYTLVSQKKRGFEVVSSVVIAISQVCYKTALAFDLNNE